MPQESTSAILTNVLIAAKAVCCVTLTVMVSILLGYSIKICKKVPNETIPYVSIHLLKILLLLQDN